MLAAPASERQARGVARAGAFLSDVHGVLSVLDAVMAEPDVAAADLIVVSVLDRLLALGDRAVLVGGRADRELVALANGGHPSTVGDAYAADLLAARQLSSERVALLTGLPHPVTVQLRGFGPVVFCHGTPRDDEAVVLVDTRLERVDPTSDPAGPSTHVLTPGGPTLHFGSASGVLGHIAARRLTVHPPDRSAAVRSPAPAN